MRKGNTKDDRLSDEIRALHQHGSDDAAGDADDCASKHLCQGVLAEQHAAGHHQAGDEDGEREPPYGIEAENGGIGYDCSDDSARACRMHADLPPQIDRDADTLYEQRNADNRHQEVWHVGDSENMHEAEIAADIDDVGNGALVTLAQLECSPTVHAAIDVDGQSGKAEGEEIYKCEQPQFEYPREKIQIGEAEQDERTESRIVRRSEDGGENACYE